MKNVRVSWENWTLIGIFCERNTAFLAYFCDIYILGFGLIVTRRIWCELTDFFHSHCIWYHPGTSRYYPTLENWASLGSTYLSVTLISYCHVNVVTCQPESDVTFACQLSEHYELFRRKKVIKSEPGPDIQKKGWTRGAAVTTVAKWITQKITYRVEIDFASIFSTPFLSTFLKAFWQVVSFFLIMGWRPATEPEPLGRPKDNDAVTT